MAPEMAPRHTQKTLRKPFVVDHAAHPTERPPAPQPKPDAVQSVCRNVGRKADIQQGLQHAAFEGPIPTKGRHPRFVQPQMFDAQSPETLRKGLYARFADGTLDQRPVDTVVAAGHEERPVHQVPHPDSACGEVSGGMTQQKERLEEDCR